MLITDSFIYIHQPKTGGTFVAQTIASLHEARGDRVDTVWFDPDRPIPLPAVGPGHVVRLMLSGRNQHGARQDVPVAYTGRPIIATIRNPFDR